MRFKNFLSEMPMKLNLVGNDWDPNKEQPDGAFDSPSYKMLTSDKAKTKIVKRMQNVPYDFNVYFVQTPNKISVTKVTLPMMNFMYPQIGITKEQAPIIEGKINMFVTSWELDPPTSWMIIHRFAHSNAELTNEVQKLIVNTGNQMSKKMTDYDLVSNFGTMKSAMSGKIGAADEPTHEIITQCIMTGSVKFNVRRNWATQKDADLLNMLSETLTRTVKNHMQSATNFVYFLF